VIALTKSLGKELADTTYYGEEERRALTSDQQLTFLTVKVENLEAIRRTVAIMLETLEKNCSGKSQPATLPGERPRDENATIALRDIRVGETPLLGMTHSRPAIPEDRANLSGT